MSYSWSLPSEQTDFTSLTQKGLRRRALAINDRSGSLVVVHGLQHLVGQFLDIAMLLFQL